jgi:hypothetical protein
MAKINNKPAEAYAKPHTMSGKEVTGALPEMSVESGNDYINKMNVSVGNITKGPYAGVKTDGIEVRGVSKQTKGKLARGPMA